MISNRSRYAAPPPTPERRQAQLRNVTWANRYRAQPVPLHRLKITPTLPVLNYFANERSMKRFRYDRSWRRPSSAASDAASCRGLEISWSVYRVKAEINITAAGNRHPKTRHQKAALRFPPCVIAMITPRIVVMIKPRAIRRMKPRRTGLLRVSPDFRLFPL